MKKFTPGNPLECKTVRQLVCYPNKKPRVHESVHTGEKTYVCKTLDARPLDVRHLGQTVLNPGLLYPGVVRSGVFHPGGLR